MLGDRIGSYIIINRKNINHCQCQSFAARRKDYDQQLTVNIISLPTFTLPSQQLAKIVQNRDHYIEEIFLAAKRRRQYLVVVTNDKRGRVKQLSLKSISLDVLTCRRLMLEAVDFCGQLNSYGTTLQTQLEDFLQTTQYSNRKSQINFIKIGKCSQKNPIQFSGQQLSKLLKFFNKLLSRIPSKGGEPFRHPQLDLLMTHIKESTECPQNLITLQHIKQCLCSTSIQKESYSLLCELLPQENVLLVQSYDKQTKKVINFTEKGFVNVVISSIDLTIQQFFYILSMKNSCEILIPSAGYISIWQRNQWITVQFTQESQTFNQNQGFCTEIEQIKLEWERENMQHKDAQAFNFRNQHKKKTNKKNEKTTPSNQNVEVPGKDIHKYPYNLVVEVTSYFIFPRKTKPLKVHGVGSLLDENLVLTCAHTIFSHIMDIEERRTADRIQIVYQGRKVEVKSYRFPQQYKKQLDKGYDFALLQLKERVNVDAKNIRLALNYRTTGNVQLMTLRREEKGSVGLKTEEQNLTMKTSCSPENMMHQMPSMKGDSGAPIIIQQEQSCYIVGIHIAALKSQFSHRQIVREGVRITQLVLKRLIDFQLQMEEVPWSKIRQLSLEWQQIRTNPFIQQLTKLSQTVKQSFRIFLEKGKRRQSKLSERLRWLKDRSQQFLQSQPKINQMFRSIYSPFPTQNIQNIIQQGQLLAENFTNYCLYEEQDPFVNKLKLCLLMMEASHEQLNQKDIKSSYESRLQWMNDVESQCSDFIPWDSLIIEFNIRSLRQWNYPPSLQLFQVSLEAFQIIQNLWKIVALNKVIPYDQKSILINSLTKGRNQLGYRQVTEPNQNKCFSFTYFKPVAEYHEGAYEIQFGVQYLYKEQLDIDFWDFTRLKHPFKLFPYLHRRIGNQARFILTNKFLRLNCFRTISECIQDNTLTLSSWVSVMLKITDFVGTLHEDLCSLSIPIEYCMYLDVIKICPVFFFYQSSNTLKFHLLRLSQQEMQQVKQYYPCLEILLDHQNVWKKSQQIDIWMLGQSFNRIFMKTLIQYPVLMFCQQLMRQIQNLLADMTRSPSLRIGLEQVKKRLMAVREMIR